MRSNIYMCLIRLNLRICFSYKKIINSYKLQTDSSETYIFSKIKLKLFFFLFAYIINIRSARVMCFSSKIN